MQTAAGDAQDCKKAETGGDEAFFVRCVNTRLGGEQDAEGGPDWCRSGIDCPRLSC